MAQRPEFESIGRHLLTAVLRTHLVLASGKLVLQIYKKTFLWIHYKAVWACFPPSKRNLFLSIRSWTIFERLELNPRPLDHVGASLPTIVSPPRPVEKELLQQSSAKIKKSEEHFKK